MKVNRLLQIERTDYLMRHGLTAFKNVKFIHNLVNHFYAPNFEKVGRAYCFWLVCLSVCLSVCASVNF